MTFEQADSIARGRVWIGADARERGLVDQIGGLDEAVKAAAARAGLEEGGYGRPLSGPGAAAARSASLSQMAARAVRIAGRLGLGGVVEHLRVSAAWLARSAGAG